ncbi:hypothetical protein RsoM2USA_221 [Ralstonia phage RsoM2USA]|nr:hypothetical protein RsoM2USA_221 [Ralstonia phage RsoM2USA]
MIEYIEISDRGAGKTTRAVESVVSSIHSSTKSIFVIAPHITAAADIVKKLKNKVNGQHPNITYYYNSCYTAPQSVIGNTDALVLMDEFTDYQDSKEIKTMLTNIAVDPSFKCIINGTLERVDWDSLVTEYLMNLTNNRYYSYDQNGVCSLINRLSVSRTARFYYAIKPRIKRK